MDDGCPVMMSQSLVQKPPSYHRNEMSASLKSKAEWSILPESDCDSVDGAPRPVKCPLCHEPSKRLRETPCGHLFCLQCLEAQARGAHQFPCPRCAAIITVPRGQSLGRVLSERFYGFGECEGGCGRAARADRLSWCQECAAFLCPTCLDEEHQDLDHPTTPFHHLQAVHTAHASLKIYETKVKQERRQQMHLLEAFIQDLEKELRSGLQRRWSFQQPSVALQRLYKFHHAENGGPILDLAEAEKLAGKLMRMMGEEPVAVHSTPKPPPLLTSSPREVALMLLEMDPPSTLTSLRSTLSSSSSDKTSYSSAETKQGSLWEMTGAKSEDWKQVPQLNEHRDISLELPQLKEHVDISLDPSPEAGKQLKLNGPPVAIKTQTSLIREENVATQTPAKPTSETKEYKKPVAVQTQTSVPRKLDVATQVKPMDTPVGTQTKTQERGMATQTSRTSLNGPHDISIGTTTAGIVPPVYHNITIPHIPHHYVSQTHVAPAKFEELPMQGSKMQAKVENRAFPTAPAAYGFTAVGEVAALDGLRVQRYGAQPYPTTDLPRLAEPRRGHAYAMLDKGCVLITGGFEKDTQRVLQTCELISLNRDGHSRMASMPKPLQGHACVNYKGNIHVCGGTSTGFVSDISQDHYLFRDGFWQPLRSMPTGRNGLAYLEYADYLYAVGGQSKWRDARGSSLEAYEPVLGMWRLMSPMLEPRTMLRAGVEGGRLWAVGGVETTGAGKRRTVEAFDARANGWTRGPDLVVPRSNFGLLQTPAGLLAVGGDEGGSVEILDTRANRWLMLPHTLPSAFHWSIFIPDGNE